MPPPTSTENASRNVTPLLSFSDRSDERAELAFYLGLCSDRVNIYASASATPSATPRLTLALCEPDPRTFSADRRNADQWTSNDCTQLNPRRAVARITRGQESEAHLAVCPAG